MKAFTISKGEDDLDFVSIYRPDKQRHYKMSNIKKEITAQTFVWAVTSLPTSFSFQNSIIYYHLKNSDFLP